MKRKDIIRLAKIKEILNEVPFGYDGSTAQTASIRGAFKFQRDMNYLRPKISDILQSMIEGNNPSDFYDSPDDLIEEVEAWIEKRKNEDWE